MAIHPKAAETFQLKPQISTLWWHEGKSQWITKVIGTHPLGNMNVMKIHPIIVESFHSGLSWSGGPTFTTSSIANDPHTETYGDKMETVKSSRVSQSVLSFWTSYVNSLSLFFKMRNETLKDQSQIKLRIFCLLQNKTSSSPKRSLNYSVSSSLSAEGVMGQT